jgi:aldoxime dehydratase
VDGPDHRDQARYIDEAGYHNILTILYWTDPQDFDRWREHHESWTGPQHKSVEAGFFSEVLQPSTRRFETLFSSDHPDGVSLASEKLSGQIQEHGYLGSARDRIPLAQTDRLDPSGELSLQTDPSTGLVTLRAHGNLCLIRSGQDWTDTDGDERRMYLQDLEPVLRAGMDFLREDGLEIGCYANRYLRVTTDNGVETDKSFAMSWWRSLKDLETWSESHPNTCRDLPGRTEVPINHGRQRPPAALPRGHRHRDKAAGFPVSRLPRPHRHAPRATIMTVRPASNTTQVLAYPPREHPAVLSQGSQLTPVSRPPRETAPV